MTPGAFVLVLAVVLALGFGLWRAVTDGRFAGTHRVRGASAETGTAPESALAGSAYADQLGARATFLQFSSAFCAPCRATRRVLSDAVDGRPDVAHVEIDAEHHLDLVRRLGILRTPTTLVLDADGTEVTRATGVPTRTQVAAALALVDRADGR